MQNWMHGQLLLVHKGFLMNMPKNLLSVLPKKQGVLKKFLTE